MEYLEACLHPWAADKGFEVLPDLSPEAVPWTSLMKHVLLKDLAAASLNSTAILERALPCVVSWPFGQAICIPVEHS